jgi:hypothetical protein
MSLSTESIDTTDNLPSALVRISGINTLFPVLFAGARPHNQHSSAAVTNTKAEILLQKSCQVVSTSCQLSGGTSSGYSKQRTTKPAVDKRLL